jgi:hypothetical protein
MKPQLLPLVIDLAETACARNTKLGKRDTRSNNLLDLLEALGAIIDACLVSPRAGLFATVRFTIGNNLSEIFSGHRSSGVNGR